LTFSAAIASTPFGVDLAVRVTASVTAALLGWAAASLIRWIGINRILTGRWEGDLTCSEFSDENKSHIIHCILVLARPQHGENSGLLYYQRECTKTGAFLQRGVDEFTDYQRFSSGLQRRRFRMIFVRRMHEYPNKTIDDRPAQYIFDCVIANAFSRGPKLLVQTQIQHGSRRDTWVGNLQKQ
jgi:hypothetical protein